MAENVQKVAMRPDVMHYLKVSGTYRRCGDGWTKFLENPGANTEETRYINMKSSTTETTDYSASYDIECDLMHTEPTVKAVYDICANREIGDKAIIEHVKYDSFSGEAWEDSVAVAITAIDGEKKMTMSGSLNVRGDAKKGTFTPSEDFSTGTFTPDVQTS